MRFLGFLGSNPAGTIVKAFLVALLVLLGFSIWRDQRLWSPENWAGRFGLELTDKNRDLVRSYILRTRILRTIGAIVGLAAPWVYATAVGEEFHMVDLRAVLIGYLVGAVIAELTMRRPRPDVPTASLAPRKISDYLPSRFISALRKVAVLAYVLAGLYFILPTGTTRFCGRRSHCFDKPVSTNDEIILFNLLAILLIVVVVELLQRYIVARPQPALEVDLLDADNAIRSASLHALAGAGVALQLQVITGEVLNIFYKLQIVPLMLLALVPFAGSVVAWVHIARAGDREVTPIEQPAST